MLVTYALGSCIAVALYDPVAKAGGLLHYMLPESAIDAAKAAANPFMFADTGIPRLIEVLRAAGGEPKRMVVRLAGGAPGLGQRRSLSDRQAQLPGGAPHPLEGRNSHRGRGGGRRGLAHHAPGSRDRQNVDSRKRRERAGTVAARCGAQKAAERGITHGILCAHRG